MKKVLVIYHFPCWDGLAAAWAIRQGYRARNEEADINYLPANYRDPVPPVDGFDKVYILDFSYSRQTLEDMAAKVPELVVIDHHHSAQQALAGLPYCVFDMEQSGASLAWGYAFEDIRAPWFILRIQDRDLWNWNIPDSKAICQWLSTQPMTFETLDRLHAEPEAMKEHAERMGTQLLGVQETMVERLAKNAFDARIHVYGRTYEVRAVNAPILQSEVGHALCEARPDAVALVFTTTGKDVRVSLRSLGNLDTTPIAEAFFGGGHKNASGCTFSHDTAAKLWQTRTLVVGDPSA